MKYLHLALPVPDCFTINCETVQIHLRGTTEGKHETARVLTETDNTTHGKWIFEENGKLYRFQGKWNYTTGGNYGCNICRNYSLHKYNFCPNCGAVMLTEKEGNE